MNKIKIIILVILILLTIAACSASQEDITFYLNQGIDTVQINDDYEDPGVTAKVFGLRRITEVIENTVDTSQIGTYHIIYSFTYQDFNMNLVRIVKVIDESPPEISLNPGIDTIKVGETWIDASITGIDNSNEDIIITKIGEVNNSLIGTYTITYKAVDTSGNENTIQRYVIVIE